MGNLNRAELIGRLGKDPELKYTQNQVAVCNLSVATTNYVKDGENTTEWHRVTCWNKTAENVANYTRKGSEVFIDGRLQTRSWDDNGVTKYTTEIVANNVQFLGSRDEASGATNRNAMPATGGVANAGTPPQDNLDDIPF